VDIDRVGMPCQIEKLFNAHTHTHNTIQVGGVVAAGVGH
jgi:hypothetical protein